MDKIQIRYRLNQAYIDGAVCADCYDRQRSIQSEIYCTGSVIYGPEVFEKDHRPLGKVPCQLWENAWKRRHYD